MKRILLLFSALMLSISALWAHDVVIDGIYYNLDETNKTAEVTYRGSSALDYSNEYIASYTIPSSITFESEEYIVTSIGDSAFYNCRELTSVNIPNTITSIGEAAFDGCTSLTNTLAPAGTAKFVFTMLGECNPESVIFTGGFTEKRWNDSDRVMTKQEDGTYVWEGDYPDNFEFKTIAIIDGQQVWLTGENHKVSAGKDVINFSGCFQGYCLESEEEQNTANIDYFGIPNSVKYIGKDAFSNCTNIKALQFGNSVTHIGGNAFYGCTSLKKVNYLGTIEEWVEINFENSSSNPTSMVKDLYINNELITDVKIISADSIKQYAFYNCESIKSIEIGNSVTSIGSQAFYGCDGLKKVNYLGTIDEWVEIDFTNKYESNPTEYAKDLYINNELVTDVKITSADSIKRCAFIYCKSIKTLEIGNSVTSIGDYAFYRCSSLASASIGENVTDMGEVVFYECYNLKNITAYPTKVPTINYYESSAQYEFGTYIAKLYVPCEALEDYELDNAFGQFKYIRCIEEEEEAPEDVEIEVDDNGNVNIKWPPTEGANSYKLVVSHAGNVICTLQFNSKGQLTSIDLGKRSASVGFEFTVTGLSQGSKYSYEMTALSEVNEVLDYYAGAFITNGYKEDDDVTTSINESITDANITVSGGKISADADFSIYNTIGQDVTAFNGSLQPGVYLVSIENNIVKVMVK